MRCVNQLIAMILLIAISMVAFLIAMNTLVRYTTRYVAPAPVLRLVSARLIFITDSENVSGVLHVTYRVDVVLSYTGAGASARACVQAVNITGNIATGAPLRVVVLPQCVTFNVTEGQRTYSALLKIPRSVLDSIGCSGGYIGCPDRTEWYIVIYVHSPERGTWERLEAVKPIYVVP